MYCVDGLGADTCDLLAFSHAQEYERPTDLVISVFTAPATIGVGTFCPSCDHVSVEVPEPVATIKVPLKLLSVTPRTLMRPIPLPPGTVIPAASVAVTTPAVRDIPVMF